jgi:MFS transporter, AAHS family, benzoate transport protein
LGFSARATSCIADDGQKETVMTLLEGAPGAGATRRGAVWVVVWLCLAVTIMDGLDLSMYGTVVPSLLKSREWGLDAGSVGLIGSLSLLGMLIGAAVAGGIADIVGRRPVILTCVASFAVFTGACAVAPSAVAFGALRFLAGLGLGGALPGTIALVQDYVRPDRRQFFNGVSQLGFPIGGVVGALVAIELIPALGWRSIFALGGLLGLVLFPVVFFLLPESVGYLARRGRTTEANALAAWYGVQDVPTATIATDEMRPSRTEAIRQLFQPGFRLASLLFPVISSFALFIFFGLATYLPQILVSNGYGFAAGMTFLVAFYLGEVVGGLGLTALAERFGSRTVIGSTFFAGAVALISLVLHLPTVVVIVLVFLVGVFSMPQTLVSGFVGIYYPGGARGSALSLDIGIGRVGGMVGPIIVGAVIGAGFAETAVFGLFAIVSVVAVPLVSLVPRTGVSDRRPRASTRSKAVAADAQTPQDAG